MNSLEIKENRKKMGLTQEELASLLGVSKRTIINYEQGTLNLDETTNLLSMHDAARMAGHTDIKMMENVYAVGEKDRAMQRLKRISNKFA